MIFLKNIRIFSDSLEPEDPQVVIHHDLSENVQDPSWNKIIIVELKGENFKCRISAKAAKSLGKKTVFSWDSELKRRYSIGYSNLYSKGYNPNGIFPSIEALFEITVNFWPYLESRHAQMIPEIQFCRDVHTLYENLLRRTRDLTSNFNKYTYGDLKNRVYVEFNNQLFECKVSDDSLPAFNKNSENLLIGHWSMLKDRLLRVQSVFTENQIEFPLTLLKPLFEVTLNFAPYFKNFGFDEEFSFCENVQSYYKNLLQLFEKKHGSTFEKLGAKAVLP